MSVEIEAVRDFLASHEPFIHLPAAELDGLAGQMTMRYVRRGDVLIRTGQPNDALHIIRTGAVDVLGKDGVLLDRREPGLTFGYSTLTGENSSRYQMVAVEDSLLLELPRKQFEQLVERNPDVDRFFSSLTRRIRAAAQQLADAASTSVLRTRMADIMSKVPGVIAPDATIVATAQEMDALHTSALLVVDGGELRGIVTDRDMRSRVIAAGRASRAADTSVAEIMTTDLGTVASDSMSMEAIMRMADAGVHHLPVVDGAEIRGMVTQADIAKLLHNDPVYLAADVTVKASPAELAGTFTEVTKLGARFAERGALPEETSAIVTLGADALARRLVELAQQEHGPAPVGFAVVAVGSQGRGEMALASDQDNALVLSDDFDADAHGEYFARLGEYVCQGLAGAGQVLCPGEMMAQNPAWRMTVSEWIDTFHGWVAAPQPDALLHAQVFFDFKVLAGDAELGQRVHRAAVDAGRGSRRLHAHLASLAARREPPLTLFRGLVVERSGKYANTIDIKKGGTAAIVQMARLYALAAGVGATATRERLRRASGAGVSAAGAQDLLDAFDYLQSMTLKHQAAQLREGIAPDYHVDPKTLGRMDREHLRDSFQIIKSMQNSLAIKYPVRNI